MDAVSPGSQKVTLSLLLSKISKPVIMDQWTGPNTLKGLLWTDNIRSFTLSETDNAGGTSTKRICESATRWQSVI